MSNIIQELKTWAKAEKEKARRNLEQSRYSGGVQYWLYRGKDYAFSDLLDKLDLLLKAENENGGKKDG